MYLGQPYDEEMELSGDAQRRIPLLPSRAKENNGSDGSIVLVSVESSSSFSSSFPLATVEKHNKGGGGGGGTEEPLGQLGESSFALLSLCTFGLSWIYFPDPLSVDSFSLFLAFFTALVCYTSVTRLFLSGVIPRRTPHVVLWGVALLAAPWSMVSSDGQWIRVPVPPPQPYNSYLESPWQAYYLAARQCHHHGTILLVPTDLHGLQYVCRLGALHHSSSDGQWIRVPVPPPQPYNSYLSSPWQAYYLAATALYLSLAALVWLGATWCDQSSPRHRRRQSPFSTLVYIVRVAMAPYSRRLKRMEEEYLESLSEQEDERQQQLQRQMAHVASLGIRSRLVEIDDKEEPPEGMVNATTHSSPSSSVTALPLQFSWAHWAVLAMAVWSLCYCFGEFPYLLERLEKANSIHD